MKECCKETRRQLFDLIEPPHYKLCLRCDCGTIVQVAVNGEKQLNFLRNTSLGFK